jgi:hypothetical protein
LVVDRLVAGNPFAGAVVHLPRHRREDERVPGGTAGTARPSRPGSLVRVSPGEILALVARFKLYRQHNCDRRHRTYLAMAKCIWPRANWIAEAEDGEGPFAVLARCRGLSVSLWSTAERAQEVKERIDRIGCGGFCGRNHEVVELVLPS